MTPKEKKRTDAVNAKYGAEAKRRGYKTGTTRHDELCPPGQDAAFDSLASEWASAFVDALRGKP